MKNFGESIYQSANKTTIYKTKHLILIILVIIIKSILQFENSKGRAETYETLIVRTKLRETQKKSYSSKIWLALIMHNEELWRNAEFCFAFSYQIRQF